MKTTTLANRKSDNQLATINDLSTAGTTLSEESLQLASGGMRFASYEAACCTFNNDTDYTRVD